MFVLYVLWDGLNQANNYAQHHKNTSGGFLADVDIVAKCKGLILYEASGPTGY
jgi:hypothetical protein